MTSRSGQPSRRAAALPPRTGAEEDERFEQRAAGGTADEEHDPDDLTGMREELRILLPGAQTLTAFLIILPFNQGFGRLQRTEQWVYLATFVCAITSLILFTAPAAQHRLERPLQNRARFKRRSNRLIIAGLVPFSLALILATHLVVNVVIQGLPQLIITASVALLIGGVWWLLPALHQRQE